MRPTCLNYRSPKEQTAEFLTPQLTSNGSRGMIGGVYYPPHKSTFSRGQRWGHIDHIAKRTSYLVGPGCYSFNISTNKGISPVMKPESIIQADQSFDKDNYMYVGNALVRKDYETRRSVSQQRSRRDSLVNQSLNMTIDQAGRASHKSSRATTPVRISYSSQGTRPKAGFEAALAKYTNVMKTEPIPERVGSAHRTSTSPLRTSGYLARPESPYSQAVYSNPSPVKKARPQSSGGKKPVFKENTYKNAGALLRGPINQKRFDLYLPERPFKVTK